jgi:hypothetical protein
MNGYNAAFVVAVGEHEKLRRPEGNCHARDLSKRTCKGGSFMTNPEQQV